MHKEAEENPQPQKKKRKKETMSFAAIWVDLEIMILSEVNQTE